MKTQDVLKKLNKVLETKKAKLIKEKRPEAAVKLNARTISGLTYKVKANYFENARNTCGFSPESMTGHSYGWYRLVDKIKGQVVLNDFRYSSQTSIHISRVSAVMDDLGIKYICLEAPRGLQNLNAALAHEMAKQATAIVREKYARNKYPQGLKSTLKDSEKRVKILASLGVKATKAMRAKASQDAENSRLATNERARKQSALNRAMKKIEIVSDFNNEMHDANGRHLVQESQWNWKDGQFSGRVSNWDLRQAVDKGLTKIIVHSKEPRHLKIVG